MQQLLEMMQLIVDAGVNVCLVCHSMIRKFELPDEMGSYDRYMLKLNEKNIAPIIKEWVDMMLFVNYRTDIVTDADGKTKKGKGGQKRIMYANHSACWDAKNRFGLPDEMPFDFGQIAHLFGEAPPVAEVHAPDPEPVPAPAPVKKDKPATVEKAAKLPEKKPMQMSRPASMQAEDVDKDELLQTLWDKMVKAGVIDPLLVQSVVAEKDYYDVTVPIRDYDKEFISDVLLEAWDQVNELVQHKMTDLPF